MQINKIKDMLIEIIKGTPIWVYFILAMLIYRGIDARHAKKIPFWQFFLFPFAFFNMATYSLITFRPFDFVSLSTLFLTFAFVFSLTWFYLSKLDLSIDKQRQLIHHSGDRWLLFILLILFASKYLLVALPSIDPAILNLLSYSIFTAAFIGMLYGFCFARAVIFFQKYKMASIQN
jgi:hypothetical protein